MIVINLSNIPDPADKILTVLVHELDRIIPDLIDGIYLTGSIPLNDFHSNKSDIDFLIFLKEFPDKNIASQLKQLHFRIQKQFKKPNLSGCYLTLESLRSYNPLTIEVLSWNEGSMRYEKFKMAPVSLYELKTAACTVFGATANSLPVNIEPRTLNTFLHQNINAYWRKWIVQHSTFLNRKFILLLFPRLTEWAILGVARQLCTLQTGKIVSKTEAGYYCLEQLPERFHPIINEAIKIRKDNRSYPIIKSYAVHPSVSHLSETINCVNYIIDQFNKVYGEIYIATK